MPRSTLAARAVTPSLPAAASFGSLMAGGNLLSHYNHPQQLQLLNSDTLLSTTGFPTNGNSTDDSSSKNGAFAFGQDRRFCNSEATAAYLRDHGLLQDIVSSHMLKEE